MNPYNSGQLIEQSTITLLAELEWEAMSCLREFNRDGRNSLGRKAKSETVLTLRLRPALTRFTPDVSHAVNEAKTWEIYLKID